MKFTKIVLIVNGVIDVFVGVSLIFFPNLMAQLLSYPALTGQAFYFAGGWGIAAISFGIARIWAGFVDKFVWYNVILGAFEGTILMIFSIVTPFLYSSMSFVNVALSLAIGSSFCVIYSTLLIIKYVKKKKEVET
ncbi:MAG: hypothetical protein ACTSSK_13245 [Candidatus Heimdallarchaeota archaeon]